MDIKKVTGIYFSPNGTTKEIVTKLARGIGSPLEEINLTALESREEKKEFDYDELVVLGFPVYADRLPAISKDIFVNLKGNNTPVIAVVSYGNEDYGDALLELTNELKKINMKVIAGLATIGEHCMNTTVAAGRPDLEDDQKILEYAGKISKKISNISNIDEIEDLWVKGNNPYRPLKPSIKPTGDSKCIQCGLCYNDCPVEAIDQEDYRKTDPDICISCGRCIQVCPTNARDIKEESFLNFMDKLEEMTKDRKEIELFI